MTTAWAAVVPDAMAFYGVGPHPDLKVVPFFNRLTRLASGPSIRRICRGFDVVVSRGETGVRAWRALRRTRDRPAFVSEAHRFTRGQPGLLDRMSDATAAGLERDVVRNADGLVFISSGIRDAIRDRHGPTAVPTLVLPSGVDPPPDDDGPPRDLDVLYAGKLEERKGVGDLIDAVPHLPPGVRVTLVGGDDLERAVIAAKAAGLGTADRIDLIGYVPPNEVRGHFRRAKVGVCPLPAGVSDVSERFTSPMKILELMACGTPVVATDLPSVREILTHDANAMLVPPGDAPALAAAIRRLLEDETLARRLADRARADVIRYVWDARAARLIDLLRQVSSR